MTTTCYTTTMPSYLSKPLIQNANKDIEIARSTSWRRSEWPPVGVLSFERFVLDERFVSTPLPFTSHASSESCTIPSSKRWNRSSLSKQERTTVRQGVVSTHHKQQPCNLPRNEARDHTQARALIGGVGLGLRSKKERDHQELAVVE